MAPDVPFYVSLVALVGLSAVGPASAAAGLARNVSPDGAIYSFATGPSGEAVLTIDSRDLHVEKSVTASGSSSLVLRAGAEEVRLEVTQDRVAVSSGESKASFVPGSGDESGAQAVRVALAQSRAVQLFRAFAAQVGARGRKDAFDEAVALSGAVIGQIAGDPDALRGFARRHRPVEGRVRPVAARLITDCWGEYERYIMWAYDQYLLCLTEGLLRLFGISYCEAQYYMRAESAWFQFLACSAIPVA